MDDIFGQLERALKDHQKGFAPSDLLELPPLERKMMNLLLRHSHLSLAEVANMLQVEHETVQPILDRFVGEKWLLVFQRGDERRYRTRFARRRARELPLNIWAAVEELIE